MDFEVVYSERKSVTIKVKDGRVILKAPIGMSMKELEAIVSKHSAWIERAIEKEKTKRYANESLSDEQKKLLVSEAKVYFAKKCEYYASVMGISYSKITITSAKTRFGSCSSARRLSFSYRLMLYPEAAREYVVVHELAHLLQMNHSPAFYAIVERYMPDYKVRRKLLES